MKTEPHLTTLGGEAVRYEHTFKSGQACVCYLQAGKLQDAQESSFSTTEGFWDLLEAVRSRRSSTWVFGHNLAYHLTLLEFWRTLWQGSDSLVNCVTADPPFFVTLRRRGSLLQFVDVLNYWRLPLRELARSAGVTASDAGSGGQLVVGCPLPASFTIEVLKTCVLSLISHLQETSLCSLRPTAPGIAWGAFLRCFLQTRILVHANKLVQTLERAAYFGGRVEQFATGFVPKPVAIMDVNSLYPFVMATSPLPLHLLKLVEGPGTAELRALLKYLDAVALVELVSGHQAIPVHSPCGVINHRGGGHACLAGDELRAMLDQCAVRRVYLAALYSRAVHFASYVKHFYAQKVQARREGKLADLVWAKLMLNSLHGKFGQKGRQWEHVKEAIAPDPYAYWWVKEPGYAKAVRYRSIAGRVERQVEAGSSVEAFVAISSCITANARCLLDGLLETCGPAYACYADTDSIHCLLPGRERLERSGTVDCDRLGGLREVARGPDAYYWGHQNYRVGNYRIHSAVKPTAIEISQGVYLQDAVAGVERTLESGALDRVIVSGRVVELSSRSKDARRSCGVLESYPKRASQREASTCGG